MSFWVNSFRCSLGSPIVSRPFTLICWTPPTSRADTSKGGCNVIEFPLSSPSKMAEPPPGRMRTGGPMHYTMKIMQDKSSGTGPSHRWKVTPVEARTIQEELRGKWEGEDRLGKVRTVAEMEEIARAGAIVRLQFPYIPGLLSFREIPALLAALGKVRHTPDLLFCDAHGYAHPRRFGLASHLGVLLDRPTIGCAKSLLIGTHGPLGAAAGSWTELVDEKAGGERIGAVLRTRDYVRPIYISQGHRVSLETAIRLTLAVRDGYRIPRPTRAADHFAGETKRKVLCAQLSEK